jgi:hypothetical protein
MGSCRTRRPVVTEQYLAWLELAELWPEGSRLRAECIARGRDWLHRHVNEWQDRPLPKRNEWVVTMMQEAAMTGRLPEELRR